MPRVADFDSFAFIVGAPRCGTTSMSKWLRAHPDIAFSSIKEPFHFARYDLRGLPDDELRRDVERQYLDRFFRDRSDGQRFGAEGSVGYLYVPEQLEPVLRLWPNSRFIIGVRDPLTLLPSLHQRLLSLGEETLTRFEDAWAAIPDRAAGRRIPRTSLDPRFLRYDEVGRLATYVERLFAVAGRERCLVVVHDDLVADPEREYRRIMAFLGLEPVEPFENAVERSSKGVRYYWLQRLLRRPPKRLWPYLARHLERREERGEKRPKSSERVMEKTFAIRKQLLRWNRLDGVSRPPVSLAVQHRIRAQLQDEVDRLGKLIGRDLGHWLQPGSEHSDNAVG